VTRKRRYFPKRYLRLYFNRQKINLSTVFAGQKVGIKQVSEEIWLVTFMDYDLSYFDHETCRLEPLENPFRAKVLPMFPEPHVAGLDIDGLAVDAVWSEPVSAFKFPC
jgi:hypothetical protein